MTSEDRELFNRLDSRLSKIEEWGEKITRLDEKLTGGNGGGICKEVADHERSLEGKVGKKEFYWIMGTVVTVGLALFGLLASAVL